MPKMPKRKSDNILPEDSLELMRLIPNIMKYLSECVTDDVDGFVRVDIKAVSGTKPWGMSLSFPIAHLEGIEPIESDENFPPPQDILEMHAPRPSLGEDGRVIAGVDIRHDTFDAFEQDEEEEDEDGVFSTDRVLR